jgi:hypothetical protein
VLEAFHSHEERWVLSAERIMSGANAIKHPKFTVARIIDYNYRVVKLLRVFAFQLKANNHHRLISYDLI